MNDPFVLFQGLEHMVTGIVVPFMVALGACLVRIAFWGWQGFKAFAANFIIAFVLGMGAHWAMMDMDIGGFTRQAITLGVAMISKELLDTIFSRRTREAVQDRIAHEISSRFRSRRHDCGAQFDPRWRERVEAGTETGRPDND